MNSRNWRDDKLGQLIKQALHESVRDARPSPQVWLNIQQGLVEQQKDLKGPRRMSRAAIPSFQASLIVALLLVLISTLPWEMARRDDGPAGEATEQAVSSTLPVVMAIDYPSEPSPIITRARDLAARRALATSVHRGVFAGTLKEPSSRPVNRQNTPPAQKIGLARARD